MKTYFIFSLILISTIAGFAESKKEEVKEKKAVKNVIESKTFLTHKKTEFRLVKDGDKFRLVKVVPVPDINNKNIPKEKNEPKDKLKEQKQLEKPINIEIKAGEIKAPPKPK